LQGENATSFAASVKALARLPSGSTPEVRRAGSQGENEFYIFLLQLLQFSYKVIFWSDLDALMKLEFASHRQESTDPGGHDLAYPKWARCFMPGKSRHSDGCKLHPFGKVNVLPVLLSYLRAKWLQ